VVRAPRHFEAGQTDTTDKTEPKGTPRKVFNAYLGYSYVGIFFGVAICVGYFGGRWLDARWKTSPWLGLVGLLVGVAAGFRELYRVTVRYQRQLSTMKRNEKAG